MTVAEVLEGGVAARAGAERVVRRRRGLEITGRDVEALRWCGEQYGVRLDVLGVLLGRLGETGGPLSVSAVRDVVGRWKRLRLAKAERLPGGVWVSLSRQGLDRVGLEEMRTVGVPLLRERHAHAVNVVRLDRESRSREGRWVSERLTWAERGGLGWHVPDGVIRVEDGRGGGWSVAVEVELSRKLRVQYQEVFARVRRGSHPVRVVRYFVATERFRDLLVADLTAVAGDRVEWSVHVLPEVPGVSYIPGRGGCG